MPGCPGDPGLPWGPASPCTQRTNEAQTGGNTASNKLSYFVLAFEEHFSSIAYL